MSEPYVGQIGVFGFNFAPVGWAVCNGQLLSISQNTALFSLIGTYYGGDGVSTFGLPNLQSRFPLHQGQGAGLPIYAMGEMGGVQNITLGISDLPSHTHVANVNNTLGVVENVSTGGAGMESPSGAVLAVGREAQYNPSPVAGNTLAAGSHTLNGSVTVTNATTGGSSPVVITPPYLVLNFCIALVGIYPSRS